LLEGGSISSNMDGVEGASDLVRCEDVRSCAIDYAIRRDWTDIVVAIMGFEVVDGRRKVDVEESYPDCRWQHGIDCTLKATLPSACSAYRLAWHRAVEDAVVEISTSLLRLCILPSPIHLCSR
jgi:hypothetical protein